MAISPGRPLDLVWLAPLLAAGVVVGCAASAEPVPGADVPAAAGEHEGDPAKATGATSTGGKAEPGASPSGDATPAAPAAPLGPQCDEDNPLTAASTNATTDRFLPDEIVQWERGHSWGCRHRRYHDTRAWDYVEATPSQAERLAYAKKVGWTRASVQEGEPGTGLDFLSMHRAMLRTLRAKIPGSTAKAL